MKTLFCIFALFILSTFLAATIINVPGDQPTIQEGINVAVDGDTILVQPGTYVENIDYIGKNITVASLFLTTQDTTYISQTIIDGNQNGSVVIFVSGEDSTAVLIGFTITNGYSSTHGGGIICINNSNPSFVNLIIIGNSAEYKGGGIFCGTYPSPSLENVIITGNSAGGLGGGIDCFNNTSPNLENVTISDNTSLYGGGISCGLNSNPDLVNVLITGNSADATGGGIFCVGASPSLINVTLSDNTANEGGGIYCYNNSSLSLVNCIMWNDSPQEVYFPDNFDPNWITITYSDIQGGEAGIVTNNNGTVNWLEGNIDEDPLFVVTGEHPFSLQDLSPCVNAGIPDTTGLNLPEFDLAGNPRVYGGRIDMGAYENQNVVVGADEVLIPLVTKLNQNYPNPFNPTTTISFDVTQTSSSVTLEIYNIKGQKVKTLVNKLLPAGEHSIVWHGRDSNGNRVSSGIYFYKFSVNGKTEAVKKCLLLK